jgi:hypothetical protein
MISRNSSQIEGPVGILQDVLVIAIHERWWTQYQSNHQENRAALEEKPLQVFGAGEGSPRADSCSFLQ